VVEESLSIPTMTTDFPFWGFHLKDWTSSSNESKGKEFMRQ
jgi:hypothetical protein